MWGGVDAELLVPPLAATAELGIAVRPAPGAQPLTMTRDGREWAVIEGGGGERRLWLPQSEAEVGRPSLLRLRRAGAFTPGSGDSRPLAVQLFELRAVDPGQAWSGDLSRPEQRAALQVRLEGAFAAERMADGSEGVWLRPRARLLLPTSAGTVRLQLWAPRPTPPETELWLAGRRAAGPLDIGRLPQEVTVEIRSGEAPGGRAEIEIVSVPYRPSEHGLADRRELGVVISGVSFAPAVGDLDGPGGRP
jgi:hypothetical protein